MWGSTGPTTAGSCRGEPCSSPPPPARSWSSARTSPQKGEGTGYPEAVMGEPVLAELLNERRAWKAAGRTVVFTNGCFDLLHPGHVALLEGARAEGDILVVAINSDRSLREIKGAGRPLTPAAERAEILLALEPVDRVVVYDEPTPAEVIRALLPDVLVKGADWALADIVGREVVEAAGGRVVRIQLRSGYSTTALVEHIHNH